MTQTAVQVWRSFKDPKAPIIVQTRKQKQLINEAIKEKLLLHQYKPPAGVEHKVWRQVYLKAPERNKLRGYEDITLPRDGNTLRHVDHGWASTAYAVQGATVPNAITIMPSHKTHLTTLESPYVGTSRHRARLAFITDNSERLVKTLEADLESKLKDIRYVTDKPIKKPRLRKCRSLTPKHSAIRPNAMIREQF